ncbi:YggT family protein [Thermoleophilia bacterium SCSIO 60948]|nr:YggT family protein [Thermoleophilia bacterium SCSIO 60948]
MIASGLTRADIADYVGALFTVYFICILLYVVLSWIQAFRPLPYNTALRAVTGFIEEVVTPYLNIFRRLLPTFGPIDLSPILAILLLLIAQSIVVSLVAG